MSKSMKRWPARVLALSVVVVLAVASFASVTAQSDTARVRVIHASPDAPAVDVYVNGTLAVEGLAFEEGTEYLDLEPGEYQFQVTPAGSSPDDAVIDATATLEAGMDYSVVAVGLVADIEALILVDDNAVPATGMAHIRVVHTSPDAPAVDVTLADGTVLVADLEYLEASEYLPVDAGTYDLQIRLAGTDTVALDIPGLMLEEGNVYSAFAMGLVEDSTLTVVPFVDASYGQNTGGGTESPAAPTEMPSQMPATGAGGTATDGSGTNWIYPASLALLGLVGLGGGALYLRTRNVRA